MCEILIKAIDATHSDPDKDRRGCYKRGDPVVVFEDGHEWGLLEGPPQFVVLKVTGLAAADAEQYLAHWKREITFTIDSSNLPADVHTLTVSATAGVAVGGEGRLTQAQVESRLARWNANVTAFAANSVTFTIGILDAIRSDGFWQRSVTGVTFTETAYTSASGTHRVRADYPVGWPSTSVEHAITTRGGVLVSHNTNTRRVVFDITRNAVRNQFESDVKNDLERTPWSRRRFRFTDAEVTAIENAGGVLTRTIAQAQAALRDRWTE